MKTYEEYLKNYLENLSNDELIELDNQYNKYKQIYYNDEDFFEIFTSRNEMARAIYYGDYRYCYEFVKINNLGNLETSDFINELIKNNYLKEDYELDEELDLIF